MKNLFNQHLPFSPATFPINYSWVILLVGIIGVIMSIPGQTMGVSVFTDSLLTALSLERLELSNAYLIGTLLSATLLPKVGRLYDKYGGRILAMLAAGLMTITLLLIASCEGIVQAISPFFASGKILPFVVITLLFFMLRFSGQGVLTMVSRTMLMKWFIENRGFANGLSGVAVAFGFSIAPGIFNGMIEEIGWQLTLQRLGLVAFGFVFFAYLFFRDTPESSNCEPDGGKILFPSEHKKTSLPDQAATVSQARKTFTFWTFNLTIALMGLYYTAITFHIADIFEKANMSRSVAFAIFVPSAFISLFCNFFGSWISDYIQLKYLLFAELIGILISAFAVMYLATYPICYYLLIVGNGIVTGLNGVLASVSWPRFFGLGHLGAITGYAMSWNVGGSALGPALFSFFERQSGTYEWACWIVIGIVLVLMMMGRMVREN